MADQTLQTINEIKTDLKAHTHEDSVRFDKMFDAMQAGFIDIRSDMKAGFDKTNAKVDTLWDAHNIQKGALGMGKWGGEIALKYGTRLAMIGGIGTLAGIGWKRIVDFLRATQ